jgi:CubicO group peptidase (beta-lactamase class C family)
VPDYPSEDCLGDTAQVSVARPAGCIEEFEELLGASLEAQSVPSIAYGIARGHEIIATRAFGMANRELGIVATPQTAYSLASITKPMTATALKLFAERGLVDLDAPINEYLPVPLVAKVGDVSDATVRRVADHSAGLGTYYRFFYDDEPYLRPPISDVIERYGKLLWAPGERHHYSNLGYGLLDTLIERVTGKPYAEAMMSEVFGPLGMTRSTIGAPRADHEAIPYGPDGIAYPHYTFDHPGGSAAYCSVEDLVRFGQFHLGFGPDVLSLDARRDMQRITIQAEPKIGYGLGWRVNQDRLGFHLVGHTGRMGGVETALRLVPEHNLVVAVVANAETELAWRAVDDALAAVLPEFRDRLAVERAQPDKNTTTPVARELFGRWEGAIETCEGPRPFALQIRGERKAVAQLGGRRHTVDELQMSGDSLLGVFDGDLGSPDGTQRPYRVHLDLTIRGGAMTGSALALTHLIHGPGGAPGKRTGNAMPHWAELRR